MNEGLAQLQSLDAAAATQSFLAYGVVFVCLVLCAVGGLRLKLFGSILAFASFVISVIAAFFLCGSIADIARQIGVQSGWSLAVGYSVVFVVVLAVTQLVFRVLVRSEVMSYPMVVDRLGGLLVGALAGLFLASIVRVGIAMTPLHSSVRPTPEQMQADATPRVLKMLSLILTNDASVRRAWLYGPSGKPFDAAAEGQFAWGEPYIDENENGQFDRDELFLDKDGDGRYTAKLSMAAQKPPLVDLAGALERYWLGNWGLVRVDVADNQRDAKPTEEAEQ